MDCTEHISAKLFIFFIIFDLLSIVELDSITRNRLLLGIATIAVLITPIAAYAANFLDIKSATVRVTSAKVDGANLLTGAKIPLDGSGKAFGYGILTGDSVIVSTTHAGVLDSETQNGNKDNPIFHNHYVHLGTDAEHCGNNPAVTAITFDSPGKLSISGSAIQLKNLPKSSEGLSQDNHVGGVVSFKLDPKFTGSHLDAVCVTNIHPADKVVIQH